MSSTSKITLKSSDGVSFEVDEAVALQSQTIKHMIEDDLADSVIPLPKVTGEILGKVIEYCKEHVKAAASEDELNTRFQASQTPAYNIQLGFCLLRIAAASGLKVWDAEFVKVDKATLFSLVLAANFLDIKSLLDLTCQTVKDMVKGKTPEEIDKFFNSKNDFTPEEKEEARVNDFLPEEEEEARVNDFIPEEEEEARLNDFIPEEEDFIPEEEEEARLNDFIPEEEEEARDNYWVLER